MKDEKYWEDLGRRAVACEGWRWVPGMLARGTVAGAVRLRYEHAYRRDSFAWPDLRDPATVGGLLALVREKHGPEVHTEPTGGGRWEFHADAEEWGGICKDTEAKALVAALEQVER